MAYNFSEFKKRIAGVEEWLQKEFSSLRTGRANPALLDSIKVESYGAWMTMSQIGSVSTEGPRTLRISPYDASQAKHVEKAIAAADLGVSVSADEKGVRVNFPELTSERRELLVKTAKSKLEEARVSLRVERDKVKSDIEKKTKANELTEDDEKRSKAEMQKFVDEANRKLDELLVKKEKEIAN